MRFFQLAEMLCKCARPECDAPPGIVPELGERLDTFRERVGQAVTVTSGLRCAWQNDRTPGAVPFSGHLNATEVDVACGTSRLRYLMLAAVFSGPKPLFPRIGLYRKHLHLGLGPSLPGRVAWVP